MPDVGYYFPGHFSSRFMNTCCPIPSIIGRKQRPSLLAPLKMTYVTKSDLNLLIVTWVFKRQEMHGIIRVHRGGGGGGGWGVIVIKALSPPEIKQSLAYSESLIS